MRIIYVAKHDQTCSNDDEGAITDALTKLGHDVQRVRESQVRSAFRVEADVCLFHHCHDFASLLRVKCPKVFWYFDLIDHPDPTLAKRCEVRKQWIADATEISKVGFCTDGDWVAKDATGKLRWLMQGADQRYVGLHRKPMPSKDNEHVLPDGRCKILYTGIERGGQGRQSFVNEMRDKYGANFHHYVSGKHGWVLAQTIAGASIVIAPDSPCTARYWSNRVYLTLGYGGFLLHPYCHGLTQHYSSRQLAMYQDREHLHLMIDYYLERQDEALRVAADGLARTIKDHTYVNRCAELCSIVKEQLNINV